MKPSASAAHAATTASAAAAASAAAPAAAVPIGLSPGLRALLSVLLALHVIAVFVGPWSMPPHGSQLAQNVASWFGPYLEIAYLNNGYRFFAPEPGPGHLVRYEIETHDGRKLVGYFPDRAAPGPRLLYHRHFMLAEFLNSISQNGQKRTADDLGTAYEQAYATHLADKYDARRVTVYLRHHNLPTIGEVRAGKQLSEPTLYEEKRVVDFEDDAHAADARPANNDSSSEAATGATNL